MNKWNKQGIKCVIICGGLGTRLFPFTVNKQKTMIEIKQKPLLGAVIEFWQPFCEEFIFVTGFKSQEVIDYIASIPIKKVILEDNEMKGIANALLQTEKWITDKCIVILGDCLISGQIDIPPDMDKGIGIYETTNEQDIKRAYSVKLNENNLVGFVEEKPQKIINSYCGTGFYFLDKSLFDYIRNTSISARTGKIEITDVIQTMINAGEKISPVMIKGNYLNVTFPEDLQRAESYFFN